MTELRRQMIDDMTVRGFSPRTQEAYVAAVARLAGYYGRSPEQISVREVQAYLVHMIRERKLSWSTCSQAVHGIRFFFHVTLGRDSTEFHVPAPKAPSRLPEILSRQEVWRILDAAPGGKHHLALSTAYSAGLRVSELVGLKVTDIDPDRMTIRVDQGKGARDRYVPLSKRLLKLLRSYWREAPPRGWLLETNGGRSHMHTSTAQRIYYAAKQRAQVTKQGGIHSLRHAFATHLVEAGTDLHTIQRFLGHRHITTTMRYLHLSRGRLTKAISPLDLVHPRDC